MKNILKQNFKEHGLLKGSIICLFFPPVFIFSIITGFASSVLMPLLILLMACFMFVYLALNALMPNVINTILNFIENVLARLAQIPSFARHFSLKKEEKVWIRSLYKKGVIQRGKKDSGTKVPRVGLRPKSEVKISSEFRRFISLSVWLFNCYELRPYFVMFLARVERMIQLNGSTYTFSYLKECMRIIVRALAGTPHMRGKVSGTWIFIALDHYGLPKILPLKLRECLREYIRYCAYTESGLGFTMNIQSEFHPNLTVPDTALPYNTKSICAVLTVAGIFRVLKTKVSADLTTVVAPFSGRYSTLPKPLIKEALSNLTTITTKRDVFDFATGGTKTIYKVIKGADLQSIIKYGKFNPHFSAKAGPNGSLATWTAALDAIAFMHEPKKALLLLGWMANQRAFLYSVWFVFLNICFGIPYIIWFYVLKAESAFVGFVSRYPAFYYPYKGTIGRFFSFWRLQLENSHGLVHTQLYLGKLGVVYDQAGKARIVASSNWWIQSAFHGLHDSLFKLLAAIPSDGTFDQRKALDRVISNMDKTQNLSGFDLSAATDRLPINLQVDILNALGIDGTTWRDLLDIPWCTNSIEGAPEFSRYSVGQPMGAYSSWAMLALTHHVVVYCSYAMSGQDFNNCNYAVLGDDVVINNDEAGAMYVRIMEGLGLVIKAGKSVISKRFTEFAKRLQGPGIDITPVGAGAILAACRSGYMFPALIKAAVGTAITTSQDLLDLVERVPSGLVAKRDLKKFVQLVLWQFFGPGSVKGVSPVQFGSLLLEWISGLPKTSAMLVEYLYDSIGMVRFRQEYKAVKNGSHIPMLNLIIAFSTVNVCKVPFLRVLETLMTFVNPGFWIYFIKALLVETVFWEKQDKFFESMPVVYEEGYLGTLQKLRYLLDNTPMTTLIEFPLTKAETKLRATFMREVLLDMNNRFNLSEVHVLHRNWYELDHHEIRAGWPDLSDPFSTIGGVRLNPETVKVPGLSSNF